MNNQITVQKVQVFEAEIDTSMTVKQTLKIFSKLENVQVESMRKNSIGFKSINIRRGDHTSQKIERYSIDFMNDTLHTMTHTTDVYTDFREVSN